MDEKGNAADYLLVDYTEKYFGAALLRNAQDTKYAPLLFKGVPIRSPLAHPWRVATSMTSCGEASFWPAGVTRT